MVEHESLAYDYNRRVVPTRQLRASLALDQNVSMWHNFLCVWSGLPRWTFLLELT